MDTTRLQEILSQPSAPFREHHVAKVLQTCLMDAKVPYFLDPIGNIVVGAQSKAEYLKLTRVKTREPLRIFVAHMDHPGFHGVEWLSDNELTFTWHGGSPTAHLEGAEVWLADAEGGWGSGRVREARMIPSGRALESGVVEITHRERPGAQRPSAGELFGGFRFRAPVWFEDRLIYTKAADDLVGSFAVVSLARELYARKRSKARPLPFLGLLTRAEEVGYIGAIAHFELGWYQRARRPLLCVSLETSRTLPGAEIGKGPVVRLGDKAGVFSSSALKVFTDLAAMALPGKHQRRIMDGGTCEATAAQVYGLQAVGISVPLGNYHNQSFEGGPDSRGPLGPAPEFVHTDDVAGLLTLCQALMRPKLPWETPWGAKRKEFLGKLRGYRPLLRGR